MALIVNGKTLRTDEEGFLEDPADWDLEVAELIAEQEGLDLDSARWTVVDFVRQHYEHNQTVPEARTVLRHLRETLGEAQATRRYLQTLFPYGYGQQACKIAGMRKPRKLMLDV
jgi:tRNA 2-thiouridine synthesizing protein E